ncbi:MAG: hypothetical protein HC915_00515 [Anaerolineae bacterium]|nr:hypothetical protein [Anaerolineae bacterium]
MATNATTWFYREPEKGRPYLISERVNHTFWQNRINDVYFTCVHAEPPFRLVGEWDGKAVELEYEPTRVFILRMQEESVPFVRGVAEILGFPPTVSYTDADGRFITEWYAKDAQKRLSEVQGNPSFQNLKRYKR